jgi:hypothetical protein
VIELFVQRAGAATTTPEASKDDGRTMDEAKLREKLSKIEALFAGAATEGERVAAGEARRRIQQRLQAILCPEDVRGCRRHAPVSRALRVDPRRRSLLRHVHAGGGARAVRPAG